MERSLNSSSREHIRQKTERYSDLFLHTTDIADGEQFIRGIEYGSEMLEESQTDKNCILEYRKTIRKLSDWLDKNGWA